MKNDEKQFLRGHLLPLAKYFFVVIFLMCQFNAMAQERKISGTVTGPDKGPLIGVTIVVKGTTVGTLTDVNGKFSLPVPSTAKTLSFTFIGMDPKEVAISATTVYDVVLSQSVISIDEVVVIGYGTQKKVSVTGSVVAISGAELVKSATTSVTNSLAGRVTGLVSVQSTGLPGASDPDVFVRGIGSLTSANSVPLMLVDGVERSFSQMDPNEIESISILKDASATAVYGIRGANGVIIVTTKRGSEGAPKISITTSAGFQKPTYMVDMADSYTYATSWNQMQKNDNPNIADAQLTFTPLAIKSFKDGKYPLIYPNSDWETMLVKKAALQTQQNINISGGSKIVKYFVSLGALYQDGIFKTYKTADSYGWNYKRYNYRANIDVDMTSSTKLSLTIGGQIQNRQTPGNTQSGLGDYYYACPFTGTLSDGKHFMAGSLYVPARNEALTDLGYGTGYAQFLTNVMNLDIAVLQKLDFVTKGLSWSIKASNNSTVSLNKTRSTSQPNYQAYFKTDLDPTAIGDSSMVYRKSGSVNVLGYSESSGKSRNWYVESKLEYARDFGTSHVTGLLLYNASRTFYPQYQGSNMPYFDIPMGYVGIAARGTYSYNSKYLLDLNLGYNGSENFAVGKRFGFFPAASVGWVLTEENFLKNKVAFLDFLKLRVSYGVVGNDRQGSNRFLYLPDSYTLSSGTGYSFGTSTDVLQPRAAEGKVGNPIVTWEKSKKQNYGIDIRAFKGLSMSFDYFFEMRDNVLTTRSAVPGLLAISLPAVNIGKVQNQGYEAELKWRSKFGSVGYYIGGNISYAHNKILFMDEPPRHDPYLVQTGKSVGAIFGYVFDGFYTADDIANLANFPNPNFGVKPGDVRFKDLNGDNVINDYDMQVIGYPNYPEYNFSISGGVNFKGFDLSMMWNGVARCSRQMDSGWRYNFGVTFDRGLLQWMADNAWTPETAATAIAPRLSINSGNHNALNSIIWLRNADYLRLKNIELGYSFTNSALLKSIGISSVRVSASGFDLLTFSKLKITDPEQSGQVYPLMQIVNLSLNVNF